MKGRLKALAVKRDKALNAAKAINEGAVDDEGDPRELTETEATAFDGHMSEVTRLNAEIEREEQLQAQMDASTPVESLIEPRATGGEPRLLQDPCFGFGSFGEFCSVLIEEGDNWKSPHRIHDDRLQIVAAAPTTFGSEGVGVDGGFLVAPEFGSEIFMHSLEGDAILPLTDNQEIGGNRITYPKDETTPWGTDGIRVYWEKEAAAATATKPKLGYTEHRLHKLLGLVPLTEELMADAAALGSFVMAGLAKSMRWKVNDAFVNGSGAGEPLGILNAAALVSVAKVTASPAQGADTLVVQNIADMFARMPAGSLGSAIWMAQNDVLPQLIVMVLNNQPIWTPVGGLSNAPAGSVLGRGLMISQHCQTLGDKGDIFFVDWSMYRSVTKRGGAQTATSMHLYFDADATAFRLTFRVDGQPKIAASISPARGSNNLSPFVTLDERA